MTATLSSDNPSRSSTNKHYKATFEKISTKKQERILNNAISEFAGKGYVAANINVIAQKAGISIGAMYKYFSSKEDLFLHIINIGYELLEEVFTGMEQAEGDIFEQIEALMRAAQLYTRQYPELTQIYLELTSEGLSHLSDRLSHKVESISAQYYKKLIERSKVEGLIDPDLDVDVTSFCLDNLILLLQFSYASGYFKERMKIFAGDDALENDEKMVQGIMRFIRQAMAPRST